MLWTTAQSGLDFLARASRRPRLELQVGRLACPLQSIDEERLDCGAN